ncbi:MAG: PorT family protein [Pyrinomonadaceae bacterium]|nr:PorT family protein [Sphingobacteriaceae bacterium]
MKITKSLPLKILFLIVTSFVMIENTFAQSQRAGVKGGLNVSNLYVDEASDENARIGIHAGFYGQLFPSDVFTIQPELLFSTRGAKYESDLGGFGNQQVTFNLSYIDLPVLAVFKVAEVVEIHAGAYASYLLKADVSYEGDLGNGTDQIDEDNLKSFDYGLVAGVGINFGAIQIGARYNYGLVEIADSDGADSILGDAKNSNAQLYIAFDFLQSK